MKKKIHTDHAPAAIGPYSQAICAGNTIYISGQIPVDPTTGNIDAADIAGQTKQSLENIKAILEAAGAGMDSIVKTTVLLADINDFGAMNEVYKTYFAEPFPARAAFQAANLPKDAKVEIEAIAVLG